MMKRWIILLLALLLLPCAALCEGEVVLQDENGNVVTGDVVEGRSLQFGDEGDDVLELQQRLTDLYYYTGNLSGRYREGTQAAVAAFQADFGLEATGIADVETQKLLFSDQNVARATPTPAPLITTAPADGTADASATAAPADAQAGNDTYIVQQ